MILLAWAVHCDLIIERWEVKRLWPCLESMSSRLLTADQCQHGPQMEGPPGCMTDHSKEPSSVISALSTNVLMRNLRFVRQGTDGKSEDCALTYKAAMTKEVSFE